MHSAAHGQERTQHANLTHGQERTQRQKQASPETWQLHPCMHAMPHNEGRNQHVRRMSFIRLTLLGGMAACGSHTLIASAACTGSMSAASTALAYRTAAALAASVAALGTVAHAVASAITIFWSHLLENSSPPEIRLTRKSHRSTMWEAPILAAIAAASAAGSSSALPLRWRGRDGLPAPPVRFAAGYGNHMVLQHGKPASIWGSVAH